MKQRRRQCAELQRTLYELFPMFDISVNKINESTTSSYLIATRTFSDHKSCRF